MWSTKARKVSTVLSVNWTSFVANSFVQLVTHSCLKSVKPFHDIPDKKLFAADSFSLKLTLSVFAKDDKASCPSWMNLSSTPMYLFCQAILMPYLVVIVSMKLGKVL